MMTRTATRHANMSAVTTGSSAHARSHANTIAKGKKRAVDPIQQTPTPPNPPPSDDDPMNESLPSNDPPNDPSGDPPEDPDDDPDDSKDQNIDKPEELTARGAIKLLVSALKSGSKKSPKTKVREPDTFDGSSPKKLRTFLAQCSLNFENRASLFTSDRAKVTYALSYLSGTAQQWFEADIISPPTLDADHYMNDYPSFVNELKLNFGPFDPKADAETAIENLVMKDNHHIAKYVVDFYRLAAEVGWDDKALCRRFYKNLPARLKNEISRLGKPKTLAEMRALSQQLDHRHWERDEEIRQENSQRKTGSSNPSSNSHTGNPHPANHSDKSHDKHKPKQSSHNHQSSNPHPNPKPSHAGHNHNHTSGTQKAPPPPEYANKLGKDGKLTPEERERHQTNKLCLFCGHPGHTVNNCPKSTSNASKVRGRASTLAQNPDTPSDSKN